jgi:hypothetical protein
MSDEGAAPTPPTRGIFITKGVRVGIPAGGLKISMSGTGEIGSHLVLHAALDVTPHWFDIALTHLAAAERALNPRRPVSSDDRYEATRAVSDQVMMQIRWDGHHRKQRSYLSELLDIANGTARGITAVRSLRYQDLRLEITPSTPCGAIRWPGDSDKEGREWLCPIDAKVRAALERILRERPGIGSAFMFPSPITPDAPVSKGRVTLWLLEAERLAGLSKLRGGTWHPYRRKWATARKGLALADVAAAGGWKSKRRCSAPTSSRMRQLC